VEVTNYDKHSSLLQHGLNYNCKDFSSEFPNIVSAHCLLQTLKQWTLNDQPANAIKTFTSVTSRPTLVN